MGRIVETRTINASPEVVFSTVADISRFSEAVPHIVSVEFLSDLRLGVGTRFRETRVMKGREATTELEVTEYEAPERVRMVADSGGCVWDTVFTVAPAGEQATLTMTMDDRPYKLLARLMNPLIRGMVTKAVVADMDAIRSYCEAEVPLRESSP